MLKTLYQFTAAVAVTLAAGALFAAQAQTPPPPPLTSSSPQATVHGTLNGSGFNAQAEAREATAADLGLAVYPGAVLQRDKPGDGAGANLGLNWRSGGSAWGFQLAVLKFSSSDSLADVAAFYRAELARYGKVLDCSAPEASRNEPPSSADKTALRCGTDGGKPGELLYKVGTRQQSRMVALQPGAGGGAELGTAGTGASSGVRFQLVRVVLPAD